MVYGVSQDRAKWSLAILKAAQLALEDPNYLQPFVSVFCDPPRDGERDDDTDQRICHEVEGVRTIKWFIGTTASKLSDVGIPPIQDDDPSKEVHPYHYNVNIGSVDDNAADRFINSFDPQVRKKESWPKQRSE